MCQAALFSKLVVCAKSAGDFSVMLVSGNLPECPVGDDETAAYSAASLLEFFTNIAARHSPDASGWVELTPAGYADEVDGPRSVHFLFGTVLPEAVRLVGPQAQWVSLSKLVETNPTLAAEAAEVIRRL
jgi:hypothetical protein